MRKFILGAAIAALATAVLASPAAAFDRHFTVLANQKSSHRAGSNAFVAKHKLLDPNNRGSKVGRDRVKCRDKGRGLKCHALFHLNGRIGGKGHIRVKGDLQRGDHHLVVIGGTRQFNGVAGKLTVHGIRLHFDLVR
ncbi:MAG TPA: hypothetical protein VHR37_03840 [Solirubrobacterales bacterium]|jgi:hypothetical protein|nr:hypothetical protein [Solirubrobacterales bacterium]